MHYLPTRIYHGARCIKDNADFFATLGKHAGIVTGASSAMKSGAFDDVTLILKQLNISYSLFNQVEENPSTDTCFHAADIFAKEHVDFIIGIGGGSPIDAAKAIALIIENPSLNSESLYHYDGSMLPHLPIVGIPTTAGTGAEVTPNAVLTEPSISLKGSIAHSMYPAAAFCDYRYLKSMPQSVRISTAIDALSHLLESFLSAKADRFSDIYCCMGLTIFSNIRTFIAKNGDLSASEYKLLMDASTIAGMTIAQTGTSLPHALSYSLTTRNHIAHGIACGVTLGGYIRLLEARDYFKVKTAMQILGFSKAEDLEQWLYSVLPNVSIAKDQKKTDVKSVLSNPKKLSTCPVILTEDELLDAYLH